MNMLPKSFPVAHRLRDDPIFTCHNRVMTLVHQSVVRRVRAAIENRVELPSVIPPRVTIGMPDPDRPTGS